MGALATASFELSPPDITETDLACGVEHALDSEGFMLMQAPDLGNGTEVGRAPR